LVKQYTKNKCKNHYKNGWLDVPDTFSYLKDNASKRDPTGSRKKRALNPAVAKQQTTKQRLAVAARKGKGKRVIEDNDDDNDNIDEEGDEEGDESEVDQEIGVALA
jgi:hypothetical protein